MPFIANVVNCSIKVYLIVLFLNISSSDFYHLLSGDVKLSDVFGECIIIVMGGTVFGEVECFWRMAFLWCYYHLLFNNL